MHGMDRTTRGNRSTTYNQNLAENDDSLSNTSETKKKIIVRIVTIFSVIFFLMCFAMIAFTLRMSEKIDAESRFLCFYVLFIYLFYLLKNYTKIKSARNTIAAAIPLHSRPLPSHPVSLVVVVEQYLLLYHHIQIIQLKKYIQC
jgi:hypothetical protein